VRRRALAAGLVVAIVALVAIGGIVACGSFGEATPADGGAAEGGTGAPADGAAGGDATVTLDGGGPLPGRKCSVGSPFPTAPVPVVVAGFGVEAVRFDPSQKVAYVALCPAAGPRSDCDLWLGTAGTTGVVATSRYGISAVGKYDSYPMPSLDGTYLLFASDRSGAPKIHAASGANGVFDAGAAQLSLPTTPNETADANEPYLLANGTLYFSATAAGSPDYDLFRSEGKRPAFGSGRLLVNVTTEVDVAPVVAEDELEMFWASDRAKSGNLDVWTGTRTAASAVYDFSAGEKAVPALSTPEVDYPTWLSPDACDLYLIHKTSVATPGELRVAHRSGM
jgi:hypothetical protein